MSDGIISIVDNQSDDFVMGSTCLFHPQFIYHEKEGRGKLFTRSSSPVQYIGTDVDSKYVWVKKPNGLPFRVRKFQLLAFEPQSA